MVALPVDPVDIRVLRPVNVRIVRTDPQHRICFSSIQAANQVWNIDCGQRLQKQPCGFSSEPLLDACRALKAIGAPLPWEIGLFRPDYQNWDLKTTVG